MFPTLAVALALCAPLSAYAQSSAPLSAKNPQVLIGQLKDMGYTIRDVDLQTGVPNLVIEKGDLLLALNFGGCEPLFHLNCGYVIASGSFSDVVGPPAEWVMKQNIDYDLIKVWLGDNKTLLYSNGAVIEGWPREAFVAWIESIHNSGNDLARQAVDDGLVNK